MLPSVMFFGCGRGAFESAFPPFRLDLGYVTYAYPENVAAQWILEWGLPAGLAGLAAIAFALRPHAVLARSTTAAGAWAAIVALTVQNLGDLGSEIPGLAIAGVVCAAIVVAGTPGQEAQWRVESWGGVPSRVAIGGVAAAMIGIVLAALGWTGELHRDQRGLRNAALNRTASVDEMHALARVAMLRHPGEPYLPFVVALRANYARDDNPIPWVGATFDRASIYPPAHLLLARAIGARSPSQTRFEYRRSVEQGPELLDVVLAEGASFADDYNEAIELVPASPQSARALEALVEALQNRLPATARASQCGPRGSLSDSAGSDAADRTSIRGRRRDEFGGPMVSRCPSKRLRAWRPGRRFARRGSRSKEMRALRTGGSRSHCGRRRRRRFDQTGHGGRACARSYQLSEAPRCHLAGSRRRRPSASGAGKDRDGRLCGRF